ncbi:MAG: carboxypeptidase regulatory-like domain-containing protein, partial [Gemmatimonadota bacterium]
MSPILMTGGSGFISATLVRRLVDGGHDGVRPPALRAPPRGGVRDAGPCGRRSPRGGTATAWGWRTRRLVGAMALLVGLTPASGHAQSQTTSAIRGAVLSTGGAPLAEVDVRVRHLPTGVERTVVTDQAGRFLVLLLQPGGPYELTATRLGYAEGRQSDLQLRVGETHVLEIVLQEQPVEVEGVRVTVERAAIFNPSQIGPVTRLNRRAIEGVPILSRDVMELTALSPLVRTTEQGGFSVAGQNDRYNAILVDGLQNQDAFGLTAQGVPGGQAGAKLLPLDAVSQYEVLVAPYDARLSGFAGGVMNAVTETGTNEWILRTVAAGRDAALMGDLTLPSGPAEASGIQRALVGLSAGGPLVRDRAHIFVSTELERRRQPPSGYNLGRDPSPLVGISEASMAEFQRHFEADHGVDTGEAGTYTLEQSLANVFTRVDWQLGEGSRITARNVFAYAVNDEPPNRSAFEPYELSS